MKSVLSEKETQRLQSVPLNPLADYQAQIAPNPKQFRKRLHDTSVKDDPDIIMLKDDPNMTVSYFEDMGNFNHAKVITSAEIRDEIMAWGSSTHKLFLWILFQLRYRRESVTLELQQMKKLGFKMADGTFRKAIKQLVNSRIITRMPHQATENDSTTGYWDFQINPQIIWKGDAKKYYKDVVDIHPEYLNGNSIKTR